MLQSFKDWMNSPSSKRSSPLSKLSFTFAVKSASKQQSRVQLKRSWQMSRRSSSSEAGLHKFASFMGYCSRHKKTKEHLAGHADDHAEGELLHDVAAVVRQQRRYL
eukprot:4915899-Pyramimonas_sp.AAC.1